MAAQPTRKRNRIPKLTEAGLGAALSSVDTLNVSQQTKALLRDMLNAAASDTPITPDSVLSGMETERRESVAQIAKMIAKQRRGVVRRARRNLLDMSEGEWQSLVEEANQG